MAMSFPPIVLRYSSVTAQNQTILVQGRDSGLRVRAKDKILRKLTALPEASGINAQGSEVRY